jgi:hypothetical protein
MGDVTVSTVGGEHFSYASGTSLMEIRKDVRHRLGYSSGPMASSAVLLVDSDGLTLGGANAPAGCYTAVLKYRRPLPRPLLRGHTGDLSSE